MVRKLAISKTAGKRIKDRGIHWKEAYHEKSETLKKKMDETVGPDAYLRYEGHDFTTNSNYYVVIGPSRQRERNVFFAGIKKLPRDAKAKLFAPYGEYFPSIHGAMSYANRKWGVPFKQGVPQYNRDTIANIVIPEHIKG